MSRIRIIATDIDGTLLPEGENRIPEETLQVLRQAADAGIDVIPASGRLISRIPPELLAISGIRYVITSNGAAILDRKTGDLLNCNMIPAEQAADALERLKEFNVFTSAYAVDGVYNWSVLPEELEYIYADRIPFFSQNPHEDLAAFVREHGMPVEKIFTVVFDQQDRQRVRDAFRDEPGIRVTSSSMWNLEINNEKADKGHALAWIAGRLDVSPDEVAAMGDNENDYSMMRFAGISIAPANAEPMIKKIASHLSDDVRDGGPAKCLAALLAQEV